MQASALQEWEASPGKAVKEAEDAEPEYQPDEGAVEQEGDQPIDGDAFAIAESTGPHEQVPALPSLHDIRIDLCSTCSRTKEGGNLAIRQPLELWDVFDILQCNFLTDGCCVTM